MAGRRRRCLPIGARVHGARDGASPQITAVATAAAGLHLVGAAGLRCCRAAERQQHAAGAARRLPAPQGMRVGRGDASQNLRYIVRS